MSDLNDYIEKDAKERTERQAILEKAKEFLEANGYEVHLEGQGYCKAAQHFHRSRRDNDGVML